MLDCFYQHEDEVGFILPDDSRTVQWKEHLIRTVTLGMVGRIGVFGDLLTQYRLTRLKHDAQIPDTSNPNKLLFGWLHSELRSKHPANGIKLCWQDKICQDLRKKDEVKESSWYMEVRNLT